MPTLGARSRLRQARGPQPARPPAGHRPRARRSRASSTTTPATTRSTGGTARPGLRPVRAAAARRRDHRRQGHLPELAGDLRRRDRRRGRERERGVITDAEADCGQQGRRRRHRLDAHDRHGCAAGDGGQHAAGHDRGPDRRRQPQHAEGHEPGDADRSAPTPRRWPTSTRSRRGSRPRTRCGRRRRPTSRSRPRSDNRRRARRRELANGDRVLVKDQTRTGRERDLRRRRVPGRRATDADAWAELPAAFTFVEQGTVNADTGWVCTADQGGTLNTTAVTWAQFSGGGRDHRRRRPDARPASTLDVVGTANRITVAADSVDISTAYVGQASITTLGTITTGTWTGTTIAVANGGTGQTTAKAARETGLSAAGYYSSATHGAGTTITITAATHGLRASRGLLVQCQTEADGVGRPAGHRGRRQRRRDRDLRQLAVGEHDPGDGDRLMPEVVGRLRTPRPSSFDASRSLADGRARSTT